MRVEDLRTGTTVLYRSWRGPRPIRVRVWGSGRRGRVWLIGTTTTGTCRRVWLDDVISTRPR